MSRRNSLSTAVALALLAVGVPACKSTPPACEKFVELADKCDTSDELGSGSERRQALEMLRGMCVGAFRDDTAGTDGETKQMVTEINAGVRKRAQCVEHATTCDQYAACTKSDYDTK